MAAASRAPWGIPSRPAPSGRVGRWGRPRPRPPWRVRVCASRGPLPRRPPVTASRARPLRRDPAAGPAPAPAAGPAPSPPRGPRAAPAGGLGEPPTPGSAPPARGRPRPPAGRAPQRAAKAHTPTPRPARPRRARPGPGQQVSVRRGPQVRPHGPRDPRAVTHIPQPRAAPQLPHPGDERPAEGIVRRLAPLHVTGQPRARGLGGRRPHRALGPVGTVVFAGPLRPQALFRRGRVAGGRGAVQADPPRPEVVARPCPLPPVGFQRLPGRRLAQARPHEAPAGIMACPPRRMGWPSRRSRVGG